MFRKFCLLILNLFLCFLASCAINPITGDEELMFFPEGQDVQIGKQYAPEVENQMGGKIDDPQLQNYINYVGQKIVRVSHDRDYEYHFTAVKDKSVNAISLPGGYVFITKGMLNKLESEAQLAGVLGHEIVHIVARDTSNMMSTQIGIEILFAAATSEKTPQDVLMAADITRQILSLQYSREDERAADLGGLDYMVRAGYNPYAMAETIQMLQKQNEVRPIEFFSTHPSPENRIGYMTEKIQRTYHNPGSLNVGREDYHQNVIERLDENKRPGI
jgi:predicted Zn-dependent protease